MRVKVIYNNLSLILLNWGIFLTRLLWLGPVYQWFLTNDYFDPAAFHHSVLMGLKILWLLLPCVENNSCWFLIYQSSGKKVKFLFNVAQMTMGTTCTIYSLFTYCYDDLLIHNISLIIIIIRWPLSWGRTPHDRWELHLSDCFMLHKFPCPSDFILWWAAFGTKAVWSQFVSVLGSYISPKLSASPSGTQLFMEPTIWVNLSCYECHYYNTSFAILCGKPTRVLVGEKCH